MVAGRDAVNCGEGKNSWLTGTASWTFVDASQYILGIYPDFDGLRLRPCIPAAWSEFEVTRKFRGATYNITVKNPKNIESVDYTVTMDGHALATNVLPVAPAGSTVNVEVTIG